MQQMIFNAIMAIFGIVITFSGFLGAFVLNGIRKDIDQARKECTDLKSEILQIHVIVAGEYVKRSELQNLTDRLLEKLDAIEAKLDNKQDKRAY